MSLMSLMSMTRMLFGVHAGRIRKAHPQVARSAHNWNRIDAAQCVKRRIARQESAI